MRSLILAGLATALLLTTFAAPVEAVGVCERTPVGPVCANVDTCDTHHTQGACVGVRTPVASGRGVCQVNVDHAMGFCHVDATVPGVGHASGTVGTRGACADAASRLADVHVHECVRIPSV